MLADDVFNSLAIPDSARIDKRIPKKTLLENTSLIASDRRLIQDAVEDMQWNAALKPSSVGIQAFKDETREYLEVSCISIKLRAVSKFARIIDLLHRSIPYPIFLIASVNDDVCISLAHKRRSQGETGKVVVDRTFTTDFFKEKSVLGLNQQAFFESLKLTNLPQNNLYQLYDSWVSRLLSLEISQITGVFRIFESLEDNESVEIKLKSYEETKRQLLKLRRTANNEKQLNTLVQLNLQIKNLELLLIQISKSL